MTIDLRKIQKEQKEWSFRCFGEQESWTQMMGIVEELGELSDSFLAHKDDADLRDKALSDFRSKLSEFFSVSDAYITKDPGNDNFTLAVTRLASKVGKLCHTFLKAHQGIRKKSLEESRKLMKDSLADIVIFMCGLCSNEGFDFEEIIQETWDEVKSRDWARYPKTGRPPAEFTETSEPQEIWDGTEIIQHRKLETVDPECYGLPPTNGIGFEKPEESNQ